MTSSSLRCSPLPPSPSPSPHPRVSCRSCSCVVRVHSGGRARSRSTGPSHAHTHTHEQHAHWAYNTHSHHITSSSISSNHYPSSHHSSFIMSHLIPLLLALFLLFTLTPSTHAINVSPPALPLNATYNCSLTSTCNLMTLTCPQGQDCSIICGTASCQDLNIVCPTGLYNCSLFCLGTGSCQSASFDCSASRGKCASVCTGAQSCQTLEQKCSSLTNFGGGATCQATCTDTSSQLLNILNPTFTPCLTNCTSQTTFSNTVCTGADFYTVPVVWNKAYTTYNISSNTTLNVFECHDPSDCQKQDLVCPDFEPCRFECYGQATCMKARLMCPPDAATQCDVLCVGAHSCQTSQIVFGRSDTANSSCQGLQSSDVSCVNGAGLQFLNACPTPVSYDWLLVDSPCSTTCASGTSIQYVCAGSDGSWLPNSQSYLCSKTQPGPFFKTCNTYPCWHQDCQYGQFVNQSWISNWQCIDCPVSTYSNVTGFGIYSCTPCKAGFYCDAQALQVPAGPCTAGYLCFNGSTTPTPTDGVMGIVCPAGSYCPSGTPVVVPCPPSYYCLAGSGSPNGLCTDSFYCTGSSPTPTQFLCPPGSRCVNGTRYLCANGTYAPDPGMTTCPQCPASSYCPTTISILPCPVGFYCPIGSRVPKYCPDGLLCPPNSAAPQQCSGGFYCPRNSSVAVPCPQYTYCPINSAAPRNCTWDAFCPPKSVAPTYCNKAVTPCSGNSQCCYNCTLLSNLPNPCRSAINTCDIPEFCNGVLPDCPPDRFYPTSTNCIDLTASGGMCYNNRCITASAQCPTLNACDLNPTGTEPNTDCGTLTCYSDQQVCQSTTLPVADGTPCRNPLGQYVWQCFNRVCVNLTQTYLDVNSNGSVILRPPPLTDPCLTANPCANGARCVTTPDWTILRANRTRFNSTKSITMKCVCPPSFYGPFCRTVILACVDCVTQWGVPNTVTSYIIGLGLDDLASATLSLALSSTLMPFNFQPSVSESLRQSAILTNTLLQWNDSITALLDTRINELQALSFVIPRLSITAQIALQRKQPVMQSHLQAYPSLHRFVTQAINSHINDLSVYVPINFTISYGPFFSTYISLPQFVYSTFSNCPLNTFDSGDGTCAPCPLTATCPSGGRAFPLPGYFSLSEHAAPFECPVPVNCAGSDFLRISTQSGTATRSCVYPYAGIGCVDCQAGYYQVNTQCYECPSYAKSQFGLLLFLFIVYLILIVCNLSFGSAASITWMAFIIVTLQLFIVIGQVSLNQFIINTHTSNLSFFFNGLAILNFDFLVMNNGCGNHAMKFDFMSRFWYVLLTLLVCFLSSVCLVVLNAFVCYNAPIKKSSANDSFAPLVKTNSLSVSKPLPSTSQQSDVSDTHRISLNLVNQDAPATSQQSDFKAPKEKMPKAHLSRKEFIYLKIFHAAEGLLVIFALQVLTLSISLVQCTSISVPFQSGTLFLNDDLSTRCYEGSHLAGVIIIASLVFTIFLALPSFVFVQLSQVLYMLLEYEEREYLHPPAIQSTFKFPPKHTTEHAVSKTHKDHSLIVRLGLVVGSKVLHSRINDYFLFHRSKRTSAGVDEHDTYHPDKVHWDTKDSQPHFTLTSKVDHLIQYTALFSHKLPLQSGSIYFRLLTLLIIAAFAFLKSYMRHDTELLFALGVCVVFYLLISVVAFPFTTFPYNLKHKFLFSIPLILANVFLALQCFTIGVPYDTHKTFYFYILIGLTGALLLLLLTRQLIISAWWKFEFITKVSAKVKYTANELLEQEELERKQAASIKHQLTEAQKQLLIDLQKDRSPLEQSIIYSCFQDPVLLNALQLLEVDRVQMWHMATELIELELKRREEVEVEASMKDWILKQPSVINYLDEFKLVLTFMRIDLNFTLSLLNLQSFLKDMIGFDEFLHINHSQMEHQQVIVDILPFYGTLKYLICKSIQDFKNSDAKYQRESYLEYFRTRHNLLLNINTQFEYGTGGFVYNIQMNDELVLQPDIQAVKDSYLKRHHKFKQPLIHEYFNIPSLIALLLFEKSVTDRESNELIDKFHRTWVSKHTTIRYLGSGPKERAQLEEEMKNQEEYKKALQDVLDDYYKNSPKPFLEELLSISWEDIVSAYLVPQPSTGTPFLPLPSSTTPFDPSIKHILDEKIAKNVTKKACIRYVLVHQIERRRNKFAEKKKAKKENLQAESIARKAAEQAEQERKQEIERLRNQFRSPPTSPMRKPKTAEKEPPALKVDDDGEMEELAAPTATDIQDENKDQDDFDYEADMESFRQIIKQLEIPSFNMPNLAFPNNVPLSPSLCLSAAQTEFRDQFLSTRVGDDGITQQFFYMLFSYSCAIDWMMKQKWRARDRLEEFRQDIRNMRQQDRLKAIEAEAMSLAGEVPTTIIEVLLPLMEQQDLNDYIAAPGLAAAEAEKERKEDLERFIQHRKVYGNSSPMPAKKVKAPPKPHIVDFISCLKVLKTYFKPHTLVPANTASNQNQSSILPPKSDLPKSNDFPLELIEQCYETVNTYLDKPGISYKLVQKTVAEMTEQEKEEIDKLKLKCATGKQKKLLEIFFSLEPMFLEYVVKQESDKAALLAVSYAEASHNAALRHEQKVEEMVKECVAPDLINSLLSHIIKQLESITKDYAFLAQKMNHSQILQNMSTQLNIKEFLEKLIDFYIDDMLKKQRHMELYPISEHVASIISTQRFYLERMKTMLASIHRDAAEFYGDDNIKTGFISIVKYLEQRAKSMLPGYSVDENLLICSPKHLPHLPARALPHLIVPESADLIAPLAQPSFDAEDQAALREQDDQVQLPGEAEQIEMVPISAPEPSPSRASRTHNRRSSSPMRSPSKRAPWSSTPSHAPSQARASIRGWPSVQRQGSIAKSVQRQSSIATSTNGK